MNLLTYAFYFLLMLFLLWFFFGGKANSNTDSTPLPLDNILNKLEIKNTDAIDLTPDIIHFIPNDEFDNLIQCDDCQNNGKFCSKGEKRCKMTLEKIYDSVFNNIRPNFLKNPKTGHNLELDCYNEELKIAIEYNGEQHYKWPNYFHKNIEEFYDQIEKDEFKKKTCEAEGIHLIIVPYNIPYKNIPSFVLQNLPDSFDEEL